MSILRRLDALAPGTITTVAGAGYHVGIEAKEADAGWPLGVVRVANGDLIVADYFGHRLWRIDGQGMLHCLAGDGVPGRRGDGGPATEARLYGPHDLCLDRHGNIYLSDLDNHTIRRIDVRSGVISHVAGTGSPGRGGDGGPAVEAELDCTCGVAVDDEGNIYLASEWMNNIRRIDSRTGVIETFAGHDARHYPSERGASRPFAGPGLSLGGYHGDGGPAREAGFNHPEHLAFDSRGDLYICDNSNDRIRKIDMTSGIISTVLGNGQRASNGDGGPATEASTLMPDAICLDVHDNLYVGEKYGCRIRKVEAATGIVHTLVGTGAPGYGEEGLVGSRTHCNACEAGIWADPDGTVHWGDCSGRLRRYDGATGIVTTAFGGTSVHDGEPAEQAFLNGPGGLSIGPDRRIYIADVWHQRIRAIDPDTGVIATVAGDGVRAYGGDNGPATQAHLGNPHDVSVDRRGRVVIADPRHAYIRRVDEDGMIRAIAGTGHPWDRGDGGPANAACVVHVVSVTHGADESIYFGDKVGRVRRIDAETGVIQTVAGCGLPGYRGDGGPATSARIGTPWAIEFDGDGRLYFSDADHHVVRMVDRDGRIRTVVGCGQEGHSPDGTPATEARLSAPRGLAIGGHGELYICDTGNHRVCRVGTDGVLTTVAGSDDGGDSGDGGPATAARLNTPHGLTLWSERILLVSDHFNNRLRAVTIGGR
ncbi:MAG: hypothetical protein CMJ18_11205 [Phycisphaeraceae bacterium]|nr:hypothetical protein [Phycisphaeraceae bacterium]